MKLNYKRVFIRDLFLFFPRRYKKMEFASSEVIFNILRQADYDTVINYCLTHKEAINICNDLYFWEQKALRDFNIPKEIFDQTDLSPSARYLQYYTKYGGVGKGSENFISLDEFMRRAFKYDRPDLIQYALNTGYDNWLLLLDFYAMKGNREMVDLYLQKWMTKRNTKSPLTKPYKGITKSYFIIFSHKHLLTTNGI